MNGGLTYSAAGAGAGVAVAVAAVAGAGVHVGRLIDWFCLKEDREFSVKQCSICPSIAVCYERELSSDRRRRESGGSFISI